MYALMKTGLLLIDIQNDYFPGGNCRLFRPEEAVERAASVLAYFRQQEMPVIHVQHQNLRPGAGYLLPRTPGAEIHEKLTPCEGEPVVIKHAPNSFHDTMLLEIIRTAELDHLVICGMMTHMCIDTTVRACKDYGIQVTLLHDACATRALTFGHYTMPAETVQNVFMAALDGIFAVVKSCEAFLIGAGDKQ